MDTEKLYFQATRELLLRTGVTLTEALFRQISLVEGRSAFDLAGEKGVSREEIERYHEERNRRYMELLTAGVSVIDGVKGILGALRGRVSQAIVTSSRREHFNAIHAGTESGADGERGEGRAVSGRRPQIESEIASHFVEHDIGSQ